MKYFSNKIRFQTNIFQTKTIQSKYISNRINSGKIFFLQCTVLEKYLLTFKKSIDTESQVPNHFVCLKCGIGEPNE